MEGENKSWWPAVTKPVVKRLKPKTKKAKPRGRSVLIERILRHGTVMTVLARVGSKEYEARFERADLDAIPDIEAKKQFIAEHILTAVDAGLELEVEDSPDMELLDTVFVPNKPAPPKPKPVVTHPVKPLGEMTGKHH